MRGENGKFFSCYRANDWECWEVFKYGGEKFDLPIIVSAGNCASAGGSRFRGNDGLRGNDGGACFDRLNNLFVV